MDGVDIFRRADDTSRVLKQRELEKKERKERKAERRKSREINIDNAAAPMVRLYICICSRLTLMRRLPTANRSDAA